MFTAVRKRLKPERQAESLVRVAQEGFNLTGRTVIHFLTALRPDSSCAPFLSSLARAQEERRGLMSGFKLMCTHLWIL